MREVIRSGQFVTRMGSLSLGYLPPGSPAEREFGAAIGGQRDLFRTSLLMFSIVGLGPRVDQLVPGERLERPALYGSDERLEKGKPWFRSRLCSERRKEKKQKKLVLSALLVIQSSKVW